MFITITKRVRNKLIRLLPLIERLNVLKSISKR